MGTTFPAAVDAFINPLPTQLLSSPSHSGQHSDANDAITAIENLLVGPVHLNVVGAPYNADPTGAVDATTRIAAAITSAISAGGGTVYFPPNSTFSVRSLSVAGNNVRFSGYGATIYGNDNTTYIFTVLGNDILFEGLELTQRSTSVTDFQQSGRGIYLEPSGNFVGCRRVHMRDLHVHNIAEIAIAADRPLDCVVESCHVHDCGGAGILMVQGEGQCSINDNHVQYVGDDGIMMQGVQTTGRTTSISGCVVIGNTVEKGGDFSIYGITTAGANGIKLAGEHVFCADNHVYNSGMRGIDISLESAIPPKYITIHNNEIRDVQTIGDGSGLMLIRVSTAAESVFITDNYLRDARYAIRSGGSNVHTEGNYITLCYQGMLIEGGAGYRIVDNRFWDESLSSASTYVPAGTTSVDRKWINLASTAVTGMLVQGNEFYGGVAGTTSGVGGVAIHSANADSVIRDNTFSSSLEYDMPLANPPSTWNQWFNNVSGASIAFSRGWRSEPSGRASFFTELAVPNTSSLPAEGAANNGLIFAESGTSSIVWYSDNKRYRAAGTTF